MLQGHILKRGEFCRKYDGNYDDNNAGKGLSFFGSCAEMFLLLSVRRHLITSSADPACGLVWRRAVLLRSAAVL